MIPDSIELAERLMRSGQLFVASGMYARATGANRAEITAWARKVLFTPTQIAEIEARAFTRITSEK